MSYRHIEELLASDRCVLLDGATGTELPRAYGGGTPLDEEIWGTRALVEAPDVVLDLHRRYVRLGCDVITTDTWGLASLLHDGGGQLWHAGREPVHWMDVARRGVRVARDAVAAEDRAGTTAVAFSLNAALDSPDGPETAKLLHRVFDDESPDLILLETLSVVRPSLDAVVEVLLATERPVWLSFRRCRHGLCGVYGQHWGGPEGDAFGRAARRFEEIGVAALLINCVPPDHVDGMVSYLPDFTDLPLGVYPNLGYYSDQGWKSAAGVGGHEYAQLALRWRAEGAQIIGGCCGVGPAHIEAARSVLERTPRGTDVRSPSVPMGQPAAGGIAAEPWTDSLGRTLYPLPVPELTPQPGVFAPTQGSLTVWRYLFNQRIGGGQRCLDVGSGTGILTAQLGLNGAEHVQAIDVDERAVRNTLDTAFRNGVSDRVSAATADLYSWVPDDRYDVIVTSLFQTPVDPLQQLSGHRPMDYWGRNLVDHLIAKLPDALTSDGAAYLMQLSILSQQRTSELLAEHGLKGEVVDFGFFPMTEHFRSARTQIEKVETLSDAYHLRLGDTDTMIAYLLKVARQP